MRRAVQCGVPPKEPLNKSSAERVAAKIGIIARRATKVVAWTTMPRSATKWHSRASLEGPGNAGIGQRRVVTTAQNRIWSVRILLRGCIFLRKTLLLSPRSHHSRRRLSRISSCKATVAPTRDLFSGSLRSCFYSLFLFLL